MLARRGGMAVRLASVVVILALVPGCKGMGGFASGFGKVAGGFGKAAAGVGRVTGSALAHATPVIARAAPVVARGAIRALPAIEDVAEGIVLAGMDDAPRPVEDREREEGGPLIDDHDPCGRCPDDLPCELCAGDGGAACRLTPADSFTRCESTAPLAPQN